MTTFPEARTSADLQRSARFREDEKERLRKVLGLGLRGNTVRIRVVANLAGLPDLPGCGSRAAAQTHMLNRLDEFEPYLHGIRFTVQGPRAPLFMVV